MDLRGGPKGCPSDCRAHGHTGNTSFSKVLSAFKTFGKEKFINENIALAACRRSMDASISAPATRAQGRNRSRRIEEAAIDHGLGKAATGRGSLFLANPILSTQVLNTHNSVG